MKDRIMVLVFCTSSHSHLCIIVCTKFNFNPFCTFKDMAQTGIHYKAKCFSGGNSVNIQGGLWFLYTALPLTVIYL